MTGHAHVTPVRVYLVVYVLLLMLLVATVGVYFVPHTMLSPAAGLAVAMAIAIVKAALVIGFFMQVVYGTKLTWLWAAIGFVWLSLLAGIMIDYSTRHMNMPDGSAFDRMQTQAPVK